jgi:hypothetical protein
MAWRAFHDIPPVHDPAGINEIMEIPGIVSVADVNADLMNPSVLYVGLPSVSPLEKEHGTTPIDRYLHSAGPFHSTDHPYPLNFEYSDHHGRSFEASLCSYGSEAELYWKQDFVEEIHSAGGTASRSQFSDDTSCDVFSPRSSISSPSEFSSSWMYSGNCPPYGVPAAGLPHTVYPDQSIALSSIQGFSDDVPETSADGHDDYGYDTAGSQSILIPVDHATTFDDSTSTQISGNKQVSTKLRSEQPSTPLSLIEEDNKDDPDYHPSSRTSSTKRTRRRSSVSKSMPDAAASTKLRGHRRTFSDKSGHAKAQNNGQAVKRRGKSRSSTKTNPLRPFPCPLAVYGCTSTFTSKNEWKRHVSTQHVKLGFWRCQLCPLSSDPANPIYNDFNRKDLFTQHVRRMHDSSTLMTRYTINSHEDDKSQDNTIPESVMIEYQTRCYQHLRSHPPQSGCLFCTQTFEGEGSWEQRMEHLGAHFEREKNNPKESLDTKRWRDDPELREWLLQEGLIAPDPKGGWHIGDGQPRRDDHFFGA